MFITDHPEFLEQLRISHGINITLSSKELAGMLEEARWMVKQMQKQNCKLQRRLAENELWEAQKREFQSFGFRFIL